MFNASVSLGKYYVMLQEKCRQGVPRKPIPVEYWGLMAEEFEKLLHPWIEAIQRRDQEMGLREDQDLINNALSVVSPQRWPDEWRSFCQRLQHAHVVYKMLERDQRTREKYPYLVVLAYLDIDPHRLVQLNSRYRDQRGRPLFPDFGQDPGEAQKKATATYDDLSRRLGLLSLRYLVHPVLQAVNGRPALWQQIQERWHTAATLIDLVRRKQKEKEQVNVLVSEAKRRYRRESVQQEGPQVHSPPHVSVQAMIEFIEAMDGVYGFVQGQIGG